MYAIIWSYQVKPGKRESFERAYGPRGVWASFFAKGEGYLGTELLRDLDVKDRYSTIERCFRPGGQRRELRIQSAARRAAGFSPRGSPKDLGASPC